MEKRKRRENEEGDAKIKRTAKEKERKNEEGREATDKAASEGE